MRIDIKPLSVNEAWRGRRFMTPKYESYRNHLLWVLPKKKPDLPERFCIACQWGFSNDAGDFDNPIKPFIDALQIKYGFNDSKIEQGLIEKVKVKKGQEFIRYFFYIEKLDFDELELKLAIR